MVIIFFTQKALQILLMTKKIIAVKCIDKLKMCIALTFFIETHDFANNFT